MTELTVVSTYVKDFLLDVRGQPISVRSGGPAWFFSRILQQRAIAYELITGAEREVEIVVMTGGEERGRVRDEVEAQPLPSTNTPNLLISTLHHEWDIRSLRNYVSRVFLDVQGFVRNPVAGFGEKKLWSEIEDVATRLFCVKATEREAQFLPEGFIEEQKQ